MRCTAASSTHTSREGQRVTRVTGPSKLAPGQGPFNEQIGQNEDAALALPQSLNPFPPTRLRRVWSLPPFLSFNTLTSLLHHDFLLVPNPFLYAQPSFSDLLLIRLLPLFAMPCFPILHPRFLEPLEEFPIVVPFPETPLLSRYLPRSHIPLRVVVANSHRSEPGALGLFNETPSTIDMSLPTPSIPVFAMLAE